MRVERLVDRTHDVVKKQQLHEWSNILINIGDGLTGSSGCSSTGDSCCKSKCE